MSPRLLIAKPFGRQHSPLEDVILSLLSVFIVVSALVIVLSPQKMTIDVAVGAPTGTDWIHFYGSAIDEAGDPLDGARVEILDGAGKRVAQAITDSDGFFEFHFKGDADTYTFAIYDPKNAAPLGSVDVDVEPGYTYGITASVTDPGIVFVAIPGY